ncbi:uncharacterized protein TNCV_1277881 [Trichonephila clavipes]|nr:uncharacterized protein TNCV_1277881 [Trichonephila clavipes]
MIRWALKLSEFNIEWEHCTGVQNVVADVLSRNPVGNLDGSQISCAALRAFTLNSREHLIREQREDPELDTSIIACFVEENHENWDRFLHEFAFALRTSVNETKNKTPAELFLGRKFITPFSKLINVTEGAEYGGRNIEKLFVESRQNMRKQHKTWEKYYNRKRREVNIKVNDLVLVQTHFISAAFRRVVGKFMPKFEGLCRVLEFRNINLIIWKKGKRVTVNIDQVRVYRPRQVRIVMLRYYMKDRGLVMGQVDRTQENSKDLGKPRVRRVKVVNQIKGSEHIDQKRPTPEPKQGIKRAIPSSVSSRNYKYRRPNNPSQGSQSIAGPLHQRDTRQGKPPTEGSKHERSGQYDKARETRKTTSGTNRAAERRPVRSKQATAVKPCSYYLRSRAKQPEGIPEEHRNRQYPAEQHQKEPQYGSLRRRSGG